MKEGGIVNSQPIDILLVEDNPDHVELILEALRNNHILNEVHVATDGEKALDFLCQRGEYTDAPRPRLILLDIKLPKVNGIEVLRRIKADLKLKSIPVVMLTTSAGEEEIVKSYSCGANSYVVKPVDFEQFTEAVRQLGFY